MLILVLVVIIGSVIIPMRKFISLSILILTFCFGSTVFGANAVSWNTFVDTIKKDCDINLEDVNGVSYTTLQSKFNSWNNFIVLRNFDGYHTFPDVPNVIYILGGQSELISASSSTSEITIKRKNNAYQSGFMLNLDTSTLSLLASGSSADLRIFIYNFVSYPQFSAANWNSALAREYFVKSLTVCGYNCSISDGTNSYTINDFSADPFPEFNQDNDSEEESGNSGDTVVDTYIPPASGRVPYFVKAPQSYLYNTRYALCNIFLPNDWSFEDIYLLVNKYDSENNILSRSILENYNNSSGDNVIFTKLDSGFWSCNLADWYEFNKSSESNLGLSGVISKLK